MRVWRSLVWQSSLRGCRVALVCIAGLFVTGGTAWGCPFCGVVGESLAERRDRASGVAIGEPAGPATRDAAGLPVQPFTLTQVIREPPPPLDTLGPSVETAALAVTARVPAPVAGLAVLFAAAAGDAQAWAAIPADELVIAHVVNAPATTEPAARRLAWFLPRLEHPDPAIAADAFTEFGLAPFEAVRAVAGGFDVDALRAWMRDPGIVQQRRGFYGLALGLAAASREADDPAAVSARAALAAEIAAPADDFRAGFDGILGGLLVADGIAGLEAIGRRGLFDAAGRPVDQRHALSALRFAWENLADTIPRPRVAAATARLLAAPAVAADAAVDLARYEWWPAVSDVAALWDTLGADDPLVRRAVAGYLAACPTPEAAAALAAIRTRDPARLTAALEAAAFPAAR
jgi:hypothetical protein